MLSTDARPLICIGLIQVCEPEDDATRGRRSRLTWLPTGFARLNPNPLPLSSASTFPDNLHYGYLQLFSLISRIMAVCEQSAILDGVFRLPVRPCTFSGDVERHQVDIVLKCLPLDLFQRPNADVRFYYATMTSV
jgi:hypothetical protein